MPESQRCLRERPSRHKCHPPPSNEIEQRPYVLLRDQARPIDAAQIVRDLYPIELQEQALNLTNMRHIQYNVRAFIPIHPQDAAEVRTPTTHLDDHIHVRQLGTCQALERLDVKRLGDR